MHSLTEYITNDIIPDNPGRSPKQAAVGADVAGWVRVEGMIDASTATFLEALAEDLQRQLGMAGSVDDVSIEQLRDGGLAIRAAIRVPRDELVISGTGENILAAYADLRKSVSQSVLESAFARIIDA